MGAPVLDCESLCILGKKLILSGALMEAGFASFVQAESEKIEAIVEKYLANAEATPPDTEDVIEVNELARDAFVQIRLIEQIIIQKINLGIGLLDDEDPCPCEEEDDGNGDVGGTGC